MKNNNIDKLYYNIEFKNIESFLDVYKLLIKKNNIKFNYNILESFVNINNKIIINNINLYEDFINELKKINNINISNIIIEPKNKKEFIINKKYYTISKEINDIIFKFNISCKWFDNDFLKNIFIDFIENDKIIKKIFTSNNIIPSSDLIFSWTYYTNPEDIKYIIINQDPYSYNNLCCGLSFAIEPDCKKIPKVLEIVFNKLNIQLNLNTNFNEWVKNGNIFQHTKNILFINLGLTLLKENNKYESHIKHWKISFIKPLLLKLLELNKKLTIIGLGKENEKFFKTVFDKLINNNLFKDKYDLKLIIDAHPGIKQLPLNYNHYPRWFE